MEILIIDGNSLLFRAYYALPFMTKKSGEPTGGIYGFFTMLMSAIDGYSPDYIAVAFDRKAKTFRHQKFEDYKAGRKPVPSDLIEQFEPLKKALRDLNVTVLERDGFEADDFLGTISKQAREHGIFSLLLTGDRDALQLIDENTNVLLTKKGVSEIVRCDTEYLKEIYNLSPAQIIDLKALMGDSSDNIPGIAGVGEKTALKLLWEFETLDGIYENLEKMPRNKLLEKLETGREIAYISRELATIECDIPTDFDFETLKFDGFATDSAAQVFSELEFYSLIKRVGITPIVAELERTTINTEQELKSVLKGAQIIAIDVDESRLVLDTDSGNYISFFDNSLFSDFNLLSAVDVLRTQITDKPIICADAKALSSTLSNYDFSVKVSDDILLQNYILNPTTRSYRADMHTSLIAQSEFNTAKLKSLGMYNVYDDIERPLTSVLCEMENVGFNLDIMTLNSLGADYEQRIAKAESEVYDLAGEEFNISSPKQLGKILFEKLELPTGRKTKSGYSTDAEVLDFLSDKHEIIPAILEFRQYSKLKSTFIDGLLKAQKNGRVHTTFVQASTATGRISSTDPNLQNIPVRQQGDIRKVFIPSDGNVLVCADYSQIELRILADMSGDEHMIDAFNNDEDIHTRTASEVFGVGLNDVTSQMRSAAKAVNFGIVYGISDFGLSRQLGISRKQAGAYIERYLEEFSGVASYMKDSVKLAKERGYAETLFGRRRPIPELTSSNFNQRSFGERVALNMPIQGSAADIIKLAMIGVASEIERRKMRCKLILQVHDELILDCPKEETAQALELLARNMSEVVDLKVPLTVHCSAGKNWAEAK